ncbi:hypothetical protein BAC3_00619 [uncultured bacterium]|nr:hypothetical protein BAC3_00619 [uncultured bacterium]
MNHIPDPIRVALQRFVSRFIPFDERLESIMLENFELRKVPRKEFLLQEGKTAEHIYFLYEGFVRFFHTKEDGTEVTSDFYFAPGFITSFTSWIRQETSQVNIQAMVKMDVLQISRTALNELYEREHLVERLGRLLAEQVFITSEKHLLSFLNDSPQERYAWLLKEYPEYVKSIPQHYLASSLGITPESFSRIRSRSLR